ncbi:protein S40-7-like [Rosa rugosa]|uniref:protein S40-7-like n=1 Tax=Rosa rugosa TaxID=74645 RepID=UPI002B407C9D|nr:protein S40-7-like [Rosa rugosa]
MDSTSFCDRRSPSSDRFLGLFSFSLPSSAAGEELNEAEVFWTTTDDFAEPEETTNNPRLTFTRPQKSGILAVLPEPDRPAQVLYRKPSLSNNPSKPIPSIPRPSLQSQASSDAGGGGQTQSVPSRRFQQHSAPMKVPVLSKAMMMERRRNLGDLADVVDDDGGDEEMLPPHELVARGSEVSARTTFSVLEGVGRTLKGRDLRQVRNAIWRKTGFLD